MYLSSQINDGLIELLDRLASTTVASYSNKAKTSDLNSALDWYFGLAFKAGLGWELDDTNQTSPPIDTQNLVSGTNRYKFSSFTEKIVDLVKLEVLDSAGTGHYLIPETMDTLGQMVVGNTSGQISGIGSQTFQERYLNAPSGIPTNYIKFGDYVYLYPNPDYSETSGLKAYFNRPASKFSYATFTVTIASPSVFSATAHGLTTNDTVLLNTTGALPTGFSADTTYYVISAGLTADAFELAASQGGSAINGTGSQSGTHSFIKTNKEPGINSMHHQFLAERAALTFRSLPANMSDPSSLQLLNANVLKAEQIISDYYANRDKDRVKRLTPVFQDNR